MQAQKLCALTFRFKCDIKIILSFFLFSHNVLLWEHLKDSLSSYIRESIMVQNTSWVYSNAMKAKKKSSFYIKRSYIYSMDIST